MLIDERHLPATLTTGPMGDVEFADLCAAHEDLRFELTADGELIVQPMPFNVSACREEELYAQLRSWAKSDGRGRACAANQWFVLPNGARRVPDAAWILKDRLATVVPQTPDKFWRIAPDFVVEIRSISDKLPVLRAKMEDWVESGVALAWLIDPERRAVEVYTKGSAAVILESPESVSADAPPIGGCAPAMAFRLDLRPIWEPLAEL